MKERKNRAPAREKRVIVERGYFHTGSSGITISMVEESQNYDWDEKDREWYNHYLEFRHSAHGAGSSYRTPIAGPAMCDYYIEAFTRLRDRILSDPEYAIPSAFNRYGYDGVLHRGLTKGCRDERHRIVEIANGLQRREVWSPDTVTGPNSSEERLLGHQYVDQETGKVVHYVPFGGRVTRDTCSSGGKALYREEDIGKTVEQALADQQRDAEAAEVAKECEQIKKLAGIVKPEKELPEEEKARLRAAMRPRKKLFEVPVGLQIDQEGIHLPETEEAVPSEPNLNVVVSDDLSEDEKREVFSVCVDELQKEFEELKKEFSHLSEDEKREIFSVSDSRPIFEGVETRTRPMTASAFLNVLEWLIKNEPESSVFYQTWHNVDAPALKASLIADTMSSPDVEAVLKVKVSSTIMAKEFTNRFG